jgi:DNA-binding response OmpR family regulator
MSDSIFLIHWHEEEAEALAEELRSQGWQVGGSESADGAEAYKAVKADPPGALVIYLTRLPSHGRHTADHIHQQRATRDVPIIFVGGPSGAVDKTRERLPDAFFVSPEELPGTLTSLLGAEKADG